MTFMNPISFSLLSFSLAGYPPEAGCHRSELCCNLGSVDTSHSCHRFCSDQDRTQNNHSSYRKSYYLPVDISMGIFLLYDHVLRLAKSSPLPETVFVKKMTQCICELWNKIFLPIPYSILNNLKVQYLTVNGLIFRLKGKIST